LSELHAIFQVAMGWDNCHLHCFEIDGLRYRSADSDDEIDEIDEIGEENVVIGDVIGVGGRFDYEYEFGDSWRHVVEVESVTALAVALKYAVCLDGERAYPPEDIGGMDTYERIVEAVGNRVTRITECAWTGLNLVCPETPSTSPLPTLRCKGSADLAHTMPRQWASLAENWSETARPWQDFQHGGPGLRSRIDVCHVAASDLHQLGFGPG